MEEKKSNVSYPESVKIAMEERRRFLMGKALRAALDRQLGPKELYPITDHQEIVKENALSDQKQTWKILEKLHKDDARAEIGINQMLESDEISEGQVNKARATNIHNRMKKFADAVGFDDPANLSDENKNLFLTREIQRIKELNEMDKPLDDVDISLLRQFTGMSKQLARVTDAMDLTNRGKSTLMTNYTALLFDELHDSIDPQDRHPDVTQYIKKTRPNYTRLGQFITDGSNKYLTQDKALENAIDFVEEENDMKIPNNIKRKLNPDISQQIDL